MKKTMLAVTAAVLVAVAAQAQLQPIVLWEPPQPTELLIGNPDGTFVWKANKNKVAKALLQEISSRDAQIADLKSKLAAAELGLKFCQRPAAPEAK